MKRLVLLVACAAMTGCVGCPFVDSQGNYQANMKYVGLNWAPESGGVFVRPQLGCQTARDLGHPEWHRLPDTVVVELIQTGQLEKPIRYSPEPPCPAGQERVNLVCVPVCPDGEKLGEDAKCYPKKKWLHSGEKAKP